ncbi:hypothetical protein LSH36_213g01003 [Paralvinella palmiformis]|uniref:Uncharacterized protein n=1 Tax=Paralvinella palmiformis TaxID=53620 RepID=A0AAD9JNQ9_9ANNE|nr:hypothetical protein LSH36_213g01003 [Paralvinella palmiformis]
MAAGAERQMNLAALQQRDPYITSIVDTASQVALYCFNPKINEWPFSESRRSEDNALGQIRNSEMFLGHM